MSQDSENSVTPNHTIGFIVIVDPTGLGRVVNSITVEGEETTIQDVFGEAIKTPTPTQVYHACLDVVKESEATQIAVQHVKIQQSLMKEMQRARTGLVGAREIPKSMVKGRK